MATEVLKIYGDRLSQPVRAVIIFCKVNGIKFEEVEIKLPTANIQNPEFQAINPLKKMPAISHGDFALFESHAILTYLACCYQVPDHWYPADLRKRAKIQSVLDWHHSTLRYGATTYLKSTILAPVFGKTPNAEVAAECEQKVIESCSTIERLWLQGDSKFLLGNDKPSVADLSLVCEIMELHMLSDEEWNRMIGPFKKVQQWIENVKEATNPHFDEVHQHLYDAIASSKQKMATEVLKLYGDRKSQPTRAVMLFCKLNGIDFEEFTIELFNQEHLSPEFEDINPVKEVPVICHGDFKLFESHAILIYLASVFPDVADHWYPADVKKRALIHSVLDWHHCHLRRGAMGYLLNTILAPARGLTMNPQSAAECEDILKSALWNLESFWLKETGKFLLGYDQPSIADLSLVCELMQFEVLDEEEKNKIFGPYKKVQIWMENTKNATRPQFDEVHKHLLFEDRPRFREAAGKSAQVQAD